MDLFYSVLCAPFLGVERGRLEEGMMSKNIGMINIYCLTEIWLAYLIH